MESRLVYELGESIGYGNLMALASAHWRKSLKEKGYPESGAFISVVSIMIKDEYIDGLKPSLDLYDSIVNSLTAPATML